VRALLAAGAAAQAADHHQRPSLFGSSSLPLLPPQAADHHQRTALHRAAERNDEECLSALLAAD